VNCVVENFDKNVVFLSEQSVVVNKSLIESKMISPTVEFERIIEPIFFKPHKSNDVAYESLGR
jgi:hypothetical protein